MGVVNKGKHEGFAWSWKERIDPKKVTEPHYNGFPAVLARLARVDVDELRELLTDAWLCQAPAALRAALD